MVDDRQLAHARRRQIGDRGTADPARADHRDMARFQLRLARTAELRQDDLARVAVEFGVAEHYSPGRRSLMPDSEARPAVAAVSSMASLSIPVDPQPPAPRVVASSVSPSSKAARSQVARVGQAGVIECKSRWLPAH